MQILIVNVNGMKDLVFFVLMLGMTHFGREKITHKPISLHNSNILTPLLVRRTPCKRIEIVVGLQEITLFNLDIYIMYHIY